MENERMRRQEVAVELLEGQDGAGVSQSASSTLRKQPSPRSELPVGGGNTMRKLMRREIGGLSGRRPPRPDAAFCAETFRRFKLQEKFLAHADRYQGILNRKTITKIIPANDFIFVIDWLGSCVAFHHTVNASVVPYKKDGGIWYFNYDGERVNDLFYNKINDSIITVSYSLPLRGYKMRAIPLESIRRCDDWSDGIPVFGSQTNKLPFFDFCNNLAIVSLKQNRRVVSNIYETNSYEFVHSIPGKIQSIASRHGIIILAYKMIHNHIPIKVLSTKDWMVWDKLSYRMPAHERLQYVQLCNENLLVKEDNQNLQVIDIWNHSNVATIEKSELKRPLKGLDLNSNNLLVEFENDMAVACNSRGEQVPLLEGALNGSTCLHVDVTRENNFAIVYSRKSIENPRDGINNSQASSVGTINICSTINGKSIVEVNPCDELDLTAATRRDGGNNRMSNTQTSDHEALKNVTVLVYDNDRHKIYTGNSSGYFHVWSN